MWWMMKLVQAQTSPELAIEARVDRLIQAAEAAAQDAEQACVVRQDEALIRWTGRVEPLHQKMRAPRFAAIAGGVLAVGSTHMMISVGQLDPKQVQQDPVTTGLAVAGVTGAFAATLGYLNLRDLGRQKKALGGRPDPAACVGAP